MSKGKAKERDPILALSEVIRGRNVREGLYDRKLYDILIKGFSQGKLHHAHLILGSGELLKLNTIRRFTAWLNCENREDNEPCGKCNSCRQVFAGTFPGYKVITPQGPTITINQVRELRREVYTKTSYPKVFVISRAEKMTFQAVSATLKVLEEPPGDNTFLFLLTPYPSVPPTIISRCVIHTVNLDREELVERVKGIVPEEDVKVLAEIFGSDLESLELAFRDIILTGDTLKLRRILGDILRDPDISLIVELAETIARNTSTNLKLFMKLGGNLASAILFLSSLKPLRSEESSKEVEISEEILKYFNISPSDLSDPTSSNLLRARALKLIDLLKWINMIKDDVEKYNSKIISYGIASHLGLDVLNRE